METSMLHRRESLILSAIDIINEHGIQGLSVREVANRQGMSNAAIFNHFKSKSELVDAVLDHYSQYDLAVIQAIESKGLESKEAIINYIEQFYTYYENYPAITAIHQAYDSLRCEPEYKEKVKRIFQSRSDLIGQMIERAQNDGRIRPEVDREALSDIILGSCSSICLKWRMNGYAFPLKERVLYTLNAILEAFSPR